MTDDLTTPGGLLEAIFWLLIGAVLTQLIATVGANAYRAAEAILEGSVEHSTEISNMLGGII